MGRRRRMVLTVLLILFIGLRNGFPEQNGFVFG